METIEQLKNIYGNRFLDLPEELQQNLIAQVNKYNSLFVNFSIESDLEIPAYDAWCFTSSEFIESVCESESLSK